MNLPINIDHLLHGRTVESERLEFKRGWNPEAVLHTLCAFANDFHNLGGGYIILGVEAKNGRPVLPPAGLSPDSLDKLQKDVLNLGFRIQPDYHPVVSPQVINGRHILVLWAPGGQTRPYKAPVNLAKGCREYAFYIRKGSSTVQARAHTERELLSLAATVPFDDRIRHDASLDDLDIGLIRDFLKEVGSGLYPDSARMDFTRLCRQMNIAAGPDEFLRPLNVGLLLFNEHPEKFFPYAQIDVVHFPDGPGADRFSEKIFKGPVHRMVREALAYIRSSLIVETVIKHPDRPEAERFFNYPYEAIEEALVNAVYHRGYDIREPVEVRILPDCVIISSQPGPDRSIRIADLKKDRFLSRRYRNRRLGEFLKELSLTEGRGTGIPKIMRAIRHNHSPRPKFETDRDRTCFATTFPIHPKARTAPAEAQAAKTESGAGHTPHVTGQDNSLHGNGKAVTDAGGTVQVTMQVTVQVAKVLDLCRTPRSRDELQRALGLKNRDHFRRAFVLPALADGLLAPTIPDKPNSSLQKYRLTDKGRQYLTQAASPKTFQ